MRLPLRWLRRFYHGPVFVAHHQDRELAHAADVVGVEARVIELTPEVGVAIFKELGTLWGSSIDLYVDLRQRLIGLGVADL